MKDIPYNSNSHETLGRVHVKYVLSKTIATFVQKVGLTWLKCVFSLVIQDTNVVVGLKLLTNATNVTTALWKQGKKLNLVFKKSERRQTKQRIHASSKMLWPGASSDNRGSRLSKVMSANANNWRFAQLCFSFTHSVHMAGYPFKLLFVF